MVQKPRGEQGKEKEERDREEKKMIVETILVCDPEYSVSSILFYVPHQNVFKCSVNVFMQKLEKGSVA